MKTRLLAVLVTAASLASFLAKAKFVGFWDGF